MVRAVRKVEVAGLTKIFDTQEGASIPALDVVVEDFDLRGKKLGRLEIDAVNRGDLAAATEQHKLLEPLVRATMNHVPGTVATKYILHGLGRIGSPRVRLPLVGPEDHEAALIEDTVSKVVGVAGVDFAEFRPDRNAAAGGALPKIHGTTR